jgi:hypothetical protein
MERVMTYHASLVISFFARRLAEIAKGQRGQYQPALLLALLWSRADPYATSPSVRLSIDQLQGIVSSDSRLRALRQLLIQVGALTWERGTYTLCKPDVDELDDIARSELAQAQSILADAQRMVGTSTESGPKTKHERQPEVRKSDAFAWLTEIGKQRSDVRDVLTTMAGIAPNKLLYSGRSAVQVRAAVDWLTTTHTSWSKFVKLCERVREDDSPDKPKRIEYLFEDTAPKRAYIQRMLANQVTSATPQTPAPQELSREEQELDLLLELVKHQPIEMLDLTRYGIQPETVDRYHAQRLQSKDSSPTTAT